MTRHKFNVGKWLPSDQEFENKWVKRFMRKLRVKKIKICFHDPWTFKIGLICFAAVGMGDVSNNEITVRIRQHVNKDDQLGMFHFDGSTHVLLFRPEVKLDFDMHGQTPGLDTTNIKVREAIAHVE
nr:phosphatidylserine decarboxylase [Lactobacillus helveticus]